MEENTNQQDPAPINKTFNKERPLKYEQKSSAKISAKLFILIGIVLAVLVAIFWFRNQINSLLVGNIQPTPTPAPIAAEPTPAPNPLIRSEWSFEVLNGSGKSGLAKDIAGKLQDLGYQVVKTGNADKSNYAQTEIWVQSNLLEKTDLIIADLKDTIKIASMAGELKDSTASARIIIGKDSI